MPLERLVARRPVLLRVSRVLGNTRSGGVNLLTKTTNDSIFRQAHKKWLWVRGDIMMRLLSFFLFGFGLCLAAASVSAQDRLPPPESDSWVAPTQFLACHGNAYALCYYSGPEVATPSHRYSDPPVMPCEVDPDNPGAAKCTCYAVEGEPVVPKRELLGLRYRFNYVLLTSILNVKVLKDTRDECGPFGKDCLNLVNLDMCSEWQFRPDQCKQAEVCSMLGNAYTGAKQTLYPDQPDVDLISTFSFAHISEHSFGSTACEAGLYAGCMTAPCTGEDENGLTTCQCPTFTGPYQVGQRSPRLKELGLGCDISPNVWSAANHITPPTE